MKTSGFTLAEVLVTLGIIGVVAALTTPALIQNVGNAKIGPKLQKAKATFETAAEMMLIDENSNSIMGITLSPAELGKKMGNYMKMSRNTEPIVYSQYKNANAVDKPIKRNSYGSEDCPRFDLDDGMSIMIEAADSATTFVKKAVASGYADTPNNQLIGYVYVDVNGPDRPNRAAKDLFVFAMYNDGTLRPYGARGSIRSQDPPMEGRLWNQNGNCTASGVKNNATCTGSIFENGMKIIYD